MDSREKGNQSPRLSQAKQSLFKHETDGIKTVKITEAYYTESFPIECNCLMYNLEITLNDGSVSEVNMKADEAILKYGTIINNPDDASYTDNLEFTNSKYGP